MAKKTKATSGQEAAAAEVRVYALAGARAQRRVLLAELSRLDRLFPELVSEGVMQTELQELAGRTIPVVTDGVNYTVDVTAAAVVKPPKPPVSAEARARMSAAQRKRRGTAKPPEDAGVAAGADTPAEVLGQVGVQVGAERGAEAGTLVGFAVAD